MRYWPINVDILDRPCLVVGGGEVGQRKARSLVRSGAAVRLVGLELTPLLREWADDGSISFLGRTYKTEYLDDAALVIAATDDAELNLRISRECRERGIWVNVVDRPELCSFIVPATVNRGDLTISVSTSGRSPALAARVRARLEDEFGPEYDRFLILMGLIRERVLAQGRSANENRKLFRQLVDSDLLESLARHDTSQVEHRLIDILGPNFSLDNMDLVFDEETAS